MRALAGAAALAWIAVALPATSGELVRFRKADGTIGLVDHPSKLPPGAVVLGVSQATETPDAAPDPPARNRRAAPPAASSASRNAADDSRKHAWCQRGRSAEQRVTRAEERLASAEESFDRCDDGGGVNYCSRASLDAAERELENAEETLSQVEADCRSGGCDPGWLRCGP
jgi:hypothetical protein